MPDLTDRLSPHFTFEEMTRTGQAQLQAANRRVPDAHMGALRAVCANLLEPIRVHFGKPVVVHSGYRSAELNRAIGGSTSSQHCLGEAADFHVQGVDLRVVFDWIRGNTELMKRVGQVILESGKVGRAPSWIHISLGAPWRPAAKSGQMLIFDGRRYTEVR